MRLCDRAGRVLRAVSSSALVVALVAVASPAASQPKRGTGGRSRPTSAAKAPEKTHDEIFEESVTAYRAGDFARAVELLKQAYAMKPAPVLLYNLARAYEGMGQFADAVRSYREYLRDEPTTPDRGAIEKRVATLEAQIAEQERLRRASEAPPPRPTDAPPPPPPPARPTIVPWILVGAGGVAAATSAALFVMAGAKQSEAERERVQVTSAELADDASSLGTIGGVVAIAAGALFVGGGTWAVLQRTGEPKDRRAHASLDARGLRVVW